MKVNSKRSFIAGVLCAVIAIVVLILYIYEKEDRLIVSFILSITMSICNFMISYSKESDFEKVKELNDERD